MKSLVQAGAVSNLGGVPSMMSARQKAKTPTFIQRSPRAQ